MNQSSADKFSIADARQIARYVGIKWTELESDELEHAKAMAYRNILKQRHAGERIDICARYVETWRQLINSEESSRRNRS